MRILAIETSCDETAVSIIEATGQFPEATYELLGTGLASQIEIHREYGGVFPQIAKREHAKALVPMLKTALEEAELLAAGETEVDETQSAKIREILSREEGLADAFLDFLKTHDLPEIDLIAVTNGPGLEPALWVGISFAKALAEVLHCGVVPTNHMEGHILASIFDVSHDNQLSPINFPAIALLISGGHTEIIKMTKWTHYEKIGQTRDDAVGEAFDKVARLLGLPYPGGPEISKLAAKARKEKLPAFGDKPLPLPMIHSGDLDFSFSGLKTAVLYAIKDKELTDNEKAAVARDFEETVAEVLLAKVTKAINEVGALTLIVGGGVSANTYLRQFITSSLLTSHPEVEVYFPHRHLSTDNAVMIALAAHAHAATARTAGSIGLIQAEGNRSL